MDKDVDYSQIEVRVIAYICSGLLGYVEARSDVHELPTLSEIDTTETARMLGVAYHTKPFLDAMVRDGRLIQYGPHYSTRKIEVL